MPDSTSYELGSSTGAPAQSTENGDEKPQSHTSQPEEERWLWAEACMLLWTLSKRASIPARSLVLVTCFRVDPPCVSADVPV
ncbi:hypothetical protein RRG08_047116 [Elysia crispata]|uniref:Uncharacterized protein n=1 Tax=Elysia crispata TaxID=231223 RepID=A0AAE1AP01_9GAST|nr:hypothetical protein RRG08_047116 [Elysia crispata]